MLKVFEPHRQAGLKYCIPFEKLRYTFVQIVFKESFIFLADISIYKIDRHSLGCGFPIWGIGTIVSGTAAILFVIMAFVIKYYRRLKQNLVYDENWENLAEMKHDAFVSYRLDLIFNTGFGNGDKLDHQRKVSSNM